MGPRTPQGQTQPNRDFGSAAGMRALGWLMRLFPRFVVYAFALIPVVWYYFARPEGRRSSRIYQKMLGLRLGPLRGLLFGLSQAKAFSRVILDNMYLGVRGPGSFRLEEHGTDVFERELARGRGLILLSAHVGNWHLAVNFLDNVERPVHLVMNDVRSEEVRRQMDAAKERSDHLTIHDARDGMELLFELRAALGRGEVVIIAGDRVTSGRKARLDFLGGKAWFPTTAFSLAAATSSPVCTALCFRTGMHRYTCFGIGPFGQGLVDSKTKQPISGRAAIDAAAQQFADHLAQHLRRFPSQWFNFHDYWAV